jgi:integrase
MRILNAEEVAHLAEAIDPQYSALVSTAAYTGCRFGELAGLKLDHLDLGRRHLTVAETLSDVNGKLALTPSPAPRQLALPRSLVEELHKHFALWPAGPDGLVFTALGGGLLRHSNFRRRTWLPALRISVGEPLSFGDLRHTHAAMLMSRGEHPKVVQLRFGHVSLQATLDRYGHLLEDSEPAAAGRLDAEYLQTFASFLAARASTYSPANQLTR